MGQVTSVIWSRHKRQLAATFGFHDTENPILLAVYAFPESTWGPSNSTNSLRHELPERNGGGVSNSPLRRARGANAVDIRALSFIPGSGVPGGTGARGENSGNERSPSGQERRLRSQRFLENDAYVLTSMPRLARIGSRRRGAGGLGYNPGPISGNNGAGAALLRSRYIHQYTNRGRIRSSLTTNIATANSSLSPSSSRNSNGSSRRRSANRPLLQVPTPSGLRVLSATASPDGSCVCVATNDETVRFFKLWSAEGPKVPVTMCTSFHEPHNRVWESALIELKEGIETIDEIIR